MTCQIMVNSQLRKNPENPILVKPKYNTTVFVHQLSNLQEKKPPLSQIPTHKWLRCLSSFLLVDRIATLERV